MANLTSSSVSTSSDTLLETVFSGSLSAGSVVTCEACCRTFHRGEPRSLKKIKKYSVGYTASPAALALPPLPRFVHVCGHTLITLQTSYSSVLGKILHFACSFTNFTHPAHSQTLKSSQEKQKLNVRLVLTC